MGLLGVVEWVGSGAIFHRSAALALAVTVIDVSRLTGCLARDSRSDGSLFGVPLLVPEIECGRTLGMVNPDILLVLEHHFVLLVNHSISLMLLMQFQFDLVV